MMKLSTAIILLSAISANSPVQANTAYTPEQCTQWLATAESADLDSSGGLSHDEYYSFLTSIEEPAFVADYFSQFGNYTNVPWQYKVIYKTMACSCMSLGGSEGCCVGDKEMLLGLDEDSVSPQLRDSVKSNYDELLCEKISFLVDRVEASLPPPVEDTPSPVDLIEETTSPVESSEESGSPTLAPAIAYADNIQSVATVQPEETGTNPLGAGAIVGILFALFIPLCAGCYVMARRRKMEEEKQLREFAGEAVRESHLKLEEEAAKVIDPEQNVVEPKVEEKSEEIAEGLEEVVLDSEEPVQEKVEEDVNKEKDESDDDDSVWSDTEDKKSEKEVIVEAETNQEGIKSTIGSALAAMGVASTVATSFITPAPKKKDDGDEDGSINALV